MLSACRADNNPPSRLQPARAGIRPLISRRCWNRSRTCGQLKLSQSPLDLEVATPSYTQFPNRVTTLNSSGLVAFGRQLQDDQCQWVPVLLMFDWFAKATYLRTVELRAG